MSLRSLSLIILPLLALAIMYNVTQAETPVKTKPLDNNTKSVVLAGGCFWCIESDYEKLDGIIKVVSGYSGGHIKNPTYKQVSEGGSGHIEVVEVTYNPEIIKYAEVLEYFWHHIDPTRDDGQFCDRGPQYRPAIFYKNEMEKQAILKSAAHIEKTKTFKDALKVEFIQASTFYPAEDYHQDYYKKSALRYKYYRYACGRDARIEELWGSK